MSSWVQLQARPIEPVAVVDGDTGQGQLPEFWQLHVQKAAATSFDGIAIHVQWRNHEGTRSAVWECPTATIARTPVGTVLHTFTEVGPLAGRVIIGIDRFGGLQGTLHYPTLPGPYQLNML